MLLFYAPVFAPVWISLLLAFDSALGYWKMLLILSIYYVCLFMPICLCLYFAGDKYNPIIHTWYIPHRMAQ